MALKVSIVGSGNWGSAIAIVMGESVKNHPEFENTIKMWVFEEIVEGQKLTEIINTKHENVKYLPGKPLPTNIVAVPDLYEATHDADILVFVLPHQFMNRTCAQMVGKIKPNAIGVSLVKGFLVTEQGDCVLISRYVKNVLEIEVAVLMGANLAIEVARGDFCEATIGCTTGDGPTLKKLFHTENFRIVVVKDSHTVELCGALKNIVACAAGFAEGLGYGNNTIAAIFRLGMMEMLKFVKLIEPNFRQETFFESSGIADLYASCVGGRNRRVSEACAKTGKSIDELEREMLNGQRLQGPHTAELVHDYLVSRNIVVARRFPLFDAVHQICSGKAKAEIVAERLKKHPEHSKEASMQLQQSIEIL